MKTLFVNYLNLPIASTKKDYQLGDITNSLDSSRSFIQVPVIDVLNTMFVISAIGTCIEKNLYVDGYGEPLWAFNDYDEAVEAKNLIEQALYQKRPATIQFKADSKLICIQNPLVVFHKIKKIRFDNIQVR